ncbi:MAG: hypothetical protein M3083_12535 [Actinomycetota bacterium]|nr:hypothetical protein [Actinomycetota bacterium]
MRPELTVDGVRPSVDELAGRIASCWLTDETVLYIGLAGTSVAGRLRDYYDTPLGGRRPHSGGRFLNTVLPSPPRWVHWAAPDDPVRNGASACNIRGFATGWRP